MEKASSNPFVNRTQTGQTFPAQGQGNRGGFAANQLGINPVFAGQGIPPQSGRYTTLPGGTNSLQGGVGAESIFMGNGSLTSAMGPYATREPNLHRATSLNQDPPHVAVGGAIYNPYNRGQSAPLTDQRSAPHPFNPVNVAVGGASSAVNNNYFSQHAASSFPPQQTNAGGIVDPSKGASGIVDSQGHVIVGNAQNPQKK